tara:strand:+ start:3056 stop:3487 length:432 start_codon:yes stop_codon:yes gene_type:complete
MKLVFKFSIFFFCTIFSLVNAKENFFIEAKNLFEKKNYEEAKFLFQRNIVFNPKNYQSYLYLAKIFKVEENESEEEKNLNTALLLEPNSEEAMYMKIEIELKRSNFSKVKELKKNFKIICSSLCDKTSSINERLNNIEAKNDS